MTFANPLALWGLFFMLVPILVHLFSFRTEKKVLFSNLNFLKEIKEESKKKQRLKHWLLLVLRLMTILAVVLAFAQPELDGKSGSQARSGIQHHVVFVDNSPSMGLVGAEGMLLEQAKSAARALGSAAAPDDRFQLLTQEFAPSSQRWLTREAFLEAIDGIVLSNRSNDLPAVYEKQYAFLANESNLKSTNVYYLSDFQREASDLERLKTDSSWQVHLLQFRPSEVPNLYIDTCWLLQPILKKGEPAKLVYVVKNGGEEAATGVRVELRMEGVQKGLGRVDLPAGGTAIDTLDFKPDQLGKLKAELILNDTYFPVDDRWYMLMEVQDSLPVLHIKGPQASVYVSALLKDDDFVNLTALTQEKIDYNAIGKYKAIVLDGLSETGSGLVAAIASAVEEGSVVLLIPGERMGMETANALLSALNGGQFTSEIKQQQRLNFLEVRDVLYQETFTNLPEQMNFPGVSRYWGYQGIESDRTLLKMQNGDPFFIRRPFGKGHLVFTLAPLSPDWTDFQSHALFVPSVYRTVLLGASIGPLSYRIGSKSPVVFQTDQSLNSGLLSMRTTGLEYIPEVRRQGAKLFFNLSVGELKPGHYEVFDASGNAVDLQVALNAVSVESDLRCQNPEELAELASQRGWFTQTITQADIAGEVLSSAKDSRLWKWILLSLLVFLLLETFVIKFLR